MPIVRIDITGPKPPEYRRALFDGVRAAVTSTLGADDARVTLRIVESPPELVDVPACRTERFTVIEVLMYEGRDDGMKAACCEAIRTALAADPGIEASEVSVYLHDASRTDLDVLPGEAAR